MYQNQNVDYRKFNFSSCVTASCGHDEPHPILNTANKIVGEVLFPPPTKKMLVITLLGTVVLFSTAVSVQQQLAFETPGPPDFCLEGPFHKNVPSPEDEDFHSCLSWQDNACCNTNLSRLIDSQKAVGLYNFSWVLCGSLSEECERFIEVCDVLCCLLAIPRLCNSSN